MESQIAARSLEQDHELFLRLKQDPAVVGEVYDLYADRLYGFILKRCGHKETAEDLLSHIFTKFLESLPDLEWKNAPLSAWLFKAASNALIDHYRRASTRLNEGLDEDWDLPGKDDPVWNTEIKIEGENIRVAMKELSARDQRVLDLKFFAGFETDEVAFELGVTSNHAAVLIYRALGRLRQKIQTK
ncbi:MAG: sigma-70 family RNA polymerase sigma factor [Patescibacteria group bacterium]|nr:sigma-70 family RNA polymerase sigma factor [Patescibacteria group bacterium]